MEKYDGNQYRVLIAEDNPTNMLLAKMSIKKIVPNVIIQEAQNGLEAFQYCQKECPSLVFMDIQMPLMNGLEAAKKILELPHCTGLPIIALSAGNVKGVRKKCIESGMVDFLPKPVVKDNIRRSFDKWLKREKSSTPVTDPDFPLPGIQDRNPEHLNVEKIKECLGEDPVVIKEILELTLIELDETYPRFTSLIHQKNIRGLKEAGHKLKGASMIAGLDRLQGI